jgi:hypothetical protein
MHQISMPYIMSDKSENKISSHLKLQSCICDHGASAFKTFNKKQLLCLERAYELNVSTRRDKKTICDNLVTSVPNFTSIPNLGALTSSEEHMGDIEPAVQKPSTSSTQHTTRKRKRKTFSSKKKNLQKSLI